MKTSVAEINNDISSPFGTYRPSYQQKAVLALSRLPILCRGWARPSWIRLLNWLRSGAIDFADPNAAFRLYPNTNLIENGILIHKDYNSAELDFLKGRLGQDCVFVDIGANIGLYTVRIAKAIAGRNGKVIAIEPNPAVLERLSFNIRANGLNNISVHSVAVGDYEGMATLNMQKGGLAIVNTVRNDESGDISVMPLRDILEAEGIDRIDALKIDIEGYEYRALAPFFAECPKQIWPKRISMEHLGEKSDIEMLLLDRGYAYKGKTRSNAFYELEGTE